MEVRCQNKDELRSFKANLLLLLLQGLLGQEGGLVLELVGRQGQNVQDSLVQRYLTVQSEDSVFVLAGLDSRFLDGEHPEAVRLSKDEIAFLLILGTLCILKLFDGEVGTNALGDGGGLLHL